MKSVFTSVFAFMSTVGALALGSPGCGNGDGDNEAEQFDTLQACVVDHTEVESLSEPNAITTCLLDHLSAMNLDFSDQAACVAYVTANGGYPASRDQACTDYFAEQ